LAPLAPITAIILTQNEEGQLARAIGSLQFCNRIVVVDSGSTDATARVATECGAEFVLHIPAPPFRISEQRNWALDSLSITTSWVLFLDADEMIPEQLAAQLSAISISSPAAFDAYELTPRYLFWGKWLRRTQGYPNWHPRFVRHGYARFSGGVWEHFDSTRSIGRIDNPYDHYANAKGLRDWIDRHYRYALWDAEHIVEFIESGNHSAIGTERKRWLRIIAARAWPLRPLARFLHMYIFRLGFLEGWKALNFCLLYFCYELMIVNLIVQIRRQRRGLDL